MVNLFYDGSRYFMAILFALYTFESFLALARDGKKGYTRQYVYIFLIHLTGFFVLCLKKDDLFYLIFFAIQQAVFLLMRNLYRAIYPQFHRALLNHMFMFLCTGMIVITRISVTKAVRQFAIAVVSLAVALLVPLLIRKVRLLKKLTWGYALCGVAALGAVLLLGAATNGSKISFSLFGFTFQPSEFVKLLFLFFLAALLCEKPNWKRIVLSALVSLLYVMILAASTDLGSAAIFFVMYVFVLSAATGKFRYIVVSALTGLGGCMAAYKLFYHVKVRVSVWLDPWKDVTGKGYQLAQSLFAIGTGGWFGFGLCQGAPESIPYVEADFIFSAISEELGTLYGICLILLCLACFFTFLQIAYGMKNPFYRLLSYGIGVTYIFQVFLTIGGGIKLIPLTGVTLPLVSYGGSSVMVTILMFAVVQGAAVWNARQQEEAWETQGAELAGAQIRDRELTDAGIQSVSLTGAEWKDAEVQDAKWSDAGIQSVELTEEEGKDAGAQDAETGYADAGAQDAEMQVIELTGAEWADIAWLRSLRRRTCLLGGLFSLLFLAMAAHILFFMTVQRETVVNHPYNIARQQALSALNVRGTIKTEDGEVLAYTRPEEDGTETRRYPYGPMFAHVVGYAANGGMGIESSMNYNLVSSHQSISGQISNDLNNEKNRGDTVITTLDLSLQELAYRLLGAENGAIIVMEPATGRILAMVSKPDFDPNEIEEIWSGLLEDEESSVLVNRVTQGMYPPGSTFKMFTALEYIRENPAETQDYSYRCGGSYRTGDGDVIYCYGHSAHGTLSFEQSFARSCNSSFANIGMTLDRRSFGKTLDELYFNRELPGSFRTNPSRVSMNRDIEDDAMLQAAIGQGDTLITPLHLCMMTCAIANNGELMAPYVVSRVENCEGGLVRRYEPQSQGNILSEEEAEQLTAMMEAVCDYGTGYRLSDEAFRVAGKTGSAEFDVTSDGAHAWFTGFAPADDPKIAVTIIIEEAGMGGDYAVPIAQMLFRSYLNGQSEIEAVP
ncbi:MAG: FtsW/RodA/SpoVE family cell cycle protein [Clostridium sp.]|nr:FtsW/RodA/SpoVE family cell cycle protein [Clostridium sp.]